MSVLGKVFVYEENSSEIRQHISHLTDFGFFVFGTDNLYLLLKYAKEVHPDVVFFNLSESFQTSDKDWHIIEQSLCYKQCPKIFIKSVEELKNKPPFVYQEMPAEGFSMQQLYQDIKKTSTQKYIH